MDLKNYESRRIPIAPQRRLIVPSLLFSLLLKSLLSGFFIAASRAERRTPDPAQLLCFREQIGINRESDVSHVLEPPNRLINLFDDSGKL